MYKSTSPDSVRSGRACPANLCVRSSPTKKLITSYQFWPVFKKMGFTVFFITETFILQNPSMHIKKKESFKNCREIFIVSISVLNKNNYKYILGKW